ERRDHARRFRVLDDPLVRDLLDDPHALLAERVAEDAEHLRPAARFAAAHPGFVDAHVREARRGRFVGGGPGDALAETIDRRLIVGSRSRHGGLGPVEQVSSDPALVVSDAACGHGVHFTASDGIISGRPGPGTHCYRNGTVTAAIRVAARWY